MKIEFSGGLDTVFGGAHELELEIPETGATVNEVISELAKIAEARGGDVNLFLQDGLVRPGILVLINDADWELLDKEDSEVGPRDVVHFSSTLHGG